VNEQRDYELGKYEKDSASQLCESISIRKQIAHRRKRVNRDKSND
jgi:hypothetical protein